MPMPIALRFQVCQHCGRREAYACRSDAVFSAPPQHCACGGAYQSRPPTLTDRLRIALGRMRVRDGRQPPFG